MRNDDGKQDESQDFFESCCKPESIVSRNRPSDLERNRTKNIHGLRTPPILRAPIESILVPFSRQVSIVLPEKSWPDRLSAENLRLETNDQTCASDITRNEIADEVLAPQPVLYRGDFSILAAYHRARPC
jgi:hypothetical protein